MMIFNTRENSGKTMAEMLAVIAIITLLAIIGIICYYLVLDKHEAEEILNKANQRAMVLSNQIQQNHPLSLNAFKEDQDHFPNTYAFINKSQFKLFLSNIEAKTCQQIKHISSTKGVIHGVIGECEALVYNKDYSAGNSPVCAEGNYLENNICYPCEQGDRTCMCPDEVPYADGQGGCCHYVTNFTDGTLSHYIGETCCPAGYEAAIQGKCCPADTPAC